MTVTPTAARPPRHALLRGLLADPDDQATATAAAGAAGAAARPTDHAAAPAGTGTADEIVAATQGLIAALTAGTVPEEVAEPLLDAVVGMLTLVEASINALTARRTALMAVASRVVEAFPATVVAMLPGAEATAQDRDHARRALVADIATATGASELTTANRVDASALLASGLTATLRAMAAGHLGEPHVRHVVRHAEGLPAEGLGAYEQDVLGRVRDDRSPAKVRALARAARERCHPSSAAERHTEAARDRAVHLDAAADGMAWLSAFLPAVQAHAIFDKLTGIAHTLREAEDEDRTLAQCRADALTALTLDPPVHVPVGAARRPTQDPATPTSPTATADDAAAMADASDLITGTAGTTAHAAGATGGTADATGSTADATGPTVDVAGPTADATGGTGATSRTADAPGPTADAPPHGDGLEGLDPALRALRPTVAVTVPVLTLLGLSDEPGSLDGYGPIDPRTARLLAAHAPSFIRLLTHPESGTVLSVGRERYAVPADLRTWLRLRDGTCRFPGCPRPAARSDLDHTTPFHEHGARGSTAASNLAHLCRMHHRLKHMSRWQVEHMPDARLAWTSPTGRRHVTEPAVDLFAATHPPSEAGSARPPASAPGKARPKQTPEGAAGQVGPKRPPESAPRQVQLKRSRGSGPGPAGHDDHDPPPF